MSAEFVQRQKGRILKKLLSIKSYPSYLEILWGFFYVKNIMRLKGVRVEAGGRFIGSPIVELTKGSRIEIGRNCSLRSTSKRTALGVNHPVILRTLMPGAVILIGDNTGISGGVICASMRVQIGNRCLIGANVTIADTDFHPIKPEGRYCNGNPEDIGVASVVIEDNVFIGTGAIILKGVKIGRNSVIGAGAVVTKEVPANSIAAGNPAKVLRKKLG